ncbi:MAG: deoxyguanosinetriphosphate triphosphohydrolase [Lachnospiraceae bacterium]|nr:deoxyguanosinetriphosphate triphosphohydrolase [Lachnospiraceae bacterium]
MNLREMQELREHDYLSPYASFSDKSLGRDVYEEECDVRPIYQRDRDRILHAKSFRRLNGKTQVFLSPEGDHYRTRLTHTLEVAQTARTISRALKLNEDLTEAIALGHDLGHTPFGHAGERALNSVCPDGFKHHEQSIRVVEMLEKDGKGLNLTKEVKDGILNHQTEGTPSTLEGKVVRFSDKFAYINHDIDDAIRGHIITEDNIPREFTDVLGHRLTERLNTLVHDIIINSMDTFASGKPDIVMSDRAFKAMKGLREYMFESVYTNPVAKSQEGKAEVLVKELYGYYMANPERLPEEYLKMKAKGQYVSRVVADYVAGMTDRYAIAKYRELKIPYAWDVY